MNLFHTLLSPLRKHRERLRERELRQRFAEIVAQTASSYEVQRYVEGRKAALKNKPPRLKRIPYAWRERANG